MIVATAELLAQVALLLASLVSRAGRRVPASVEAVDRLSRALYPEVAKVRQVAAQGQYEILHGHLVSEYGLLVEPAPVRPYPLDAVRQAVFHASGLDGEGVVVRPTSVREFRERLGKTLQQHVANAGRELVIDTAELNSVQEISDEQQAAWDEEEARRDREEDPDGDDDILSWSREDNVTVTEAPYQVVQPFDADDDRTAKEILTEATEEREERVKKATAARKGVRGPVLGWARVLVGAENCAFCAMLASRGAVYKSEATAGFVAHTVNASGVGGDCDCQCVCVVKGQPWEGEKEAALLQDMWEDARDNPTEDEKKVMEEQRKLVSPAARFRSRFNRRLREEGMEAFRSDAARLAESRVQEMRDAYRPKSA